VHARKRETVYALQQEKFEGHIVPLLLENCDHEELSWVLRSLQMIDFREDFDTGCGELLRIWGIGYRGPGSRA
jgi:hypothetical protein